MIELKYYVSLQLLHNLHYKHTLHSTIYYHLQSLKHAVVIRTKKICS